MTAALLFSAPLLAAPIVEAPLEIKDILTGAEGNPVFMDVLQQEADRAGDFITRPEVWGEPVSWVEYRAMPIPEPSMPSDAPIAAASLGFTPIAPAPMSIEQIYSDAKQVALCIIGLTQDERIVVDTSRLRRVLGDRSYYRGLLAARRRLDAEGIERLRRHQNGALAPIAARLNMLFDFESRQGPEEPESPVDVQDISEAGKPSTRVRLSHRDRRKLRYYRPEPKENGARVHSLLAGRGIPVTEVYHHPGSSFFLTFRSNDDWLKWSYSIARTLLSHGFDSFVLMSKRLRANAVDVQVRDRLRP